MEKILISACLIGDNTKYNGGNNLVSELEGLLAYYDFVPFCPEVEGGLPTPRDPSEQKGISVYSNKGKDVTKEFNLGAEKTLSLCKMLGITKAILKERSPSCGTHQISDGHFAKRYIKGMGVTARLLAEHGISVYNEEEAIQLLNDKKTEEERKQKAHERYLERQNQEENAKEDKTSIVREKKPFKKDLPSHGHKKAYSRGPRKSYEGSRYKKSGQGIKKFGEKKTSRKPSYHGKRNYGKSK